MKSEYKRGAFTKFLGRSFFKMTGWTLIGTVPDAKHAVFIAYPHTSYIDGIWMVATSYAMGIRLSWLGKDSLFKFPFKNMVEFFGGIPVDRKSRNDTVRQISDQFESRKGMYLAIAPAGTRTKGPHWKSGFYHIALEAGVPLFCGCVDYTRKEAGIIGVLTPTGDRKKDMDALRKIYEGREGKYVEKMTPIGLRDEE